MQHRHAFYVVALLAAACGARSPLDVPFATSGTTATSHPASGADAATTATTSHPRSLSAGWSHACAITKGGQVACWGNYFTDGQDGASDTPVVIPGLDDSVELAAGDMLNCARANDGTVSCWGHATKGAVLPVRGTQFDSIVAGSSTACGVTTAGRVACVGTPFFDGKTCEVASAPWDGVATIVPSLSGIAGVALGSFHACAFDGAGATSCWGCSAGDEDRLVYSLGSNTPSTITPVRVPGAPRTTRIAASTASTCTVQSDGTILCWGDRSQFGRGITVHPTPPVAADFPPNPIDLGVSPTFACAAYADEVTCLGGLPTFEDGCKDRSDSARSFTVPGVREIAVGYENVCARDAQGAVWCWGCNSEGEVGDGTRTARATPVRVLD